MVFSIPFNSTYSIVPLLWVFLSLANADDQVIAYKIDYLNLQGGKIILNDREYRLPLIKTIKIQ